MYSVHNTMYSDHPAGNRGSRLIGAVIIACSSYRRTLGSIYKLTVENSFFLCQMFAIMSLHLQRMPGRKECNTPRQLCTAKCTAQLDFKCTALVTAAKRKVGLNYCLPYLITASNQMSLFPPCTLHCVVNSPMCSKFVKE